MTTTPRAAVYTNLHFVVTENVENVPEVTVERERGGFTVVTVRTFNGSFVVSFESRAHYREFVRAIASGLISTAGDGDDRDELRAARALETAGSPHCSTPDGPIPAVDPRPMSKRISDLATGH